MYTFDGNNFIDRWPHNLDDLGIESYVDRLDAAFIWGKNGKTYFFSGSEYWKLDSKTLKRDAGYPVGMTRWRNLPYPVDTAFKWRDGKWQTIFVRRFYILSSPAFL